MTFKSRVGSSPTLGTIGRLAQLVERLAYTENVGGSSPSSPTNATLAQLVEHATENCRVSGSSPEGGTNQPRHSEMSAVVLF